MAPGQISAVVGLLEIMLDSLARALAIASHDDEPESEDGNPAVAAIQTGQGIPHHKILSEFGLSPEDFERLGKTPLPTSSGFSR